MSILIAPPLESAATSRASSFVQMDPIVEVSDFVSFVVFRMDELGGYPTQINEEHVQTLLNTDSATSRRFVELSDYSKLNYRIYSLIVQARNNGLNVEEHLRERDVIPPYDGPKL